jgi:hypothetical protein
MPDRILVDFAGEGSGVAELAWGQQLMWDAAQKQNSSLPLGGAMAMPPGTTLDFLVLLLRFAMSRHQSLRTRLRPGTDGRPEQVLYSSGQIAVELAEAGDADPAEIADAMRVRYCLTEVDYADEWPVRVGVVLRDGSPTHLVAIYCHVATDGHGLDLLAGDLATMDPATGLSTVSVAGTPPLAQARWQQSPAGLQHSAAAMGHFERLLRSIPSQRFAGSQDERRPRHWQLVYSSPAMQLAVPVIAARCGLDTAPVLLAAFATALARVTGRHPSAAQVMVSNRFRRELAGAVSTVSQPGLCVIDIRDVTFDEVVRRAWRSAMSAYKHAYYDSRQRDDLVARLATERGEEIDIACYFNDRRIHSRQPAAAAPATEDELRAALGRSVLRWERPVDDTRERLFVHVNDVADLIDIEVSADTRYVSPAEMESLARTMEETVVTAALDPAARNGSAVVVA